MDSSAHKLEILESLPQRESADVQSFLKNSAQSTLLRFSTAGSVDDGKSTLVGRLLHDTGNILDDHLAALHKRAAKEGGTALSLALVTDGLKSEREQGITIDVAYRYFSTPKRRFILADTPGHEQYTRNMATGCSTADLTIILVDARYGLVSQTKRHSFISSLLGIPRFVIAVNKMDLVDYSEKVFENIRRDYTEFAGKLAVKDVRFIPISALQGDNVVTRSSAMPWYHGETVMEYLENVYIGGDANHVDFRFPVQLVLRPNQDYRGYAGQVASGEIRVGEEVLALPSMRRSRITSIDQYSRKPSAKPIEVAVAPMSVTLTLDSEIDIARGDMLVRPGNQPHPCNHFEAMLVWTGDTAMDLSKRYLVQHTSRQVKCSVDTVRYRIDVNTLSRLDPAPLGASEIGRVTISTGSPLFLDPYRVNRATGNFILIDPDTFQTAAAGMVIDRVSEEVGRSSERTLHREQGLVTMEERDARYGGTPLTYWFTGLSGSGKSSIAIALERKLFDRGQSVYRLDGDNIRNGLSSDLGFSPHDRRENIRRVAEVAKLFNDAGVTVICSLISPLAEDRAQARTIIGEDAFREVYLSTSIAVCEERDPHGLYKKARAGKISQFTGVSAPYEVPTTPDLKIDTANCSIENAIAEILEKLKGKRG